MVKLQKPTPKSLNKDGSKDKQKKSNNFKKEKQPEAKNPIPASNVTAKKEKIKLIEKTIKEQPETLLKPTKKEKKNKGAPNVPQPQKEEQVVKKSNKKNKKKGQQQAPAAVETKVEVNQEVKKAAKIVAVSQESNQVKVPKGQKRKATAVTANAQEKGKVGDKASVTKSQKKKKGKQQKQTAAKGGKETDEVAPMPTVPFDEEKFNTLVTVQNIKKIGQALKSMVEKQVTEKKTAIFDDFRYFLNVCSFKIPNCPKRIVKLNLAHSLVNPSEDDVVIVVPDLKRGAKADYEPTIQHYEDLFREHEISGLKIVPFNQLRKECTTIEAKRKFANTYDYFLCDGRIVSHVVGFCGNHFQRTRSNFHAVRLNNPKTYKREVEQALKRTSYKQLHKGDLISIPVGTHRFTIDQLTDNIKIVVDQLKTLFPGGLGNVRNMHVKIDIKGTTSLPIYSSVGAPPAETPNVIGMREQRMLKLKKEANEVLSQFNMSKTGEFVKLDRAQAERKRQIQEARKAVLTEAPSENVENDAEEEVPAKKSKKSKKEIKEEPQPAVEDEEEEDDDDIEAGADQDEEGDDDDDDEEEDDDDDDVDSDEE